MSLTRSNSNPDFKKTQIDAVNGNPEAQYVLAQCYYSDYLDADNCGILSLNERLHLAKAWLCSALKSTQEIILEEKNEKSISKNIQLKQDIKNLLIHVHEKLDKIYLKEKIQRATMFDYLLDLLDSKNCELALKAQKWNLAAQYQLADVLKTKGYNKLAKSILLMAIRNIHFSLEDEKALYLMGKINEETEILTAKHWYVVAAANGSETACVNLCRQALKHYQDTNELTFAIEAIHWDEASCLLSAEKGNAHHQLYFGKKALQNKEYKEAEKYLKTAAKIFPEANCMLGLMYSDPDNPLFDRAEANKCYYDMKLRLGSEMPPADMATRFYELEERIKTLNKQLKEFLEEKRKLARAEVEENLQAILAVKPLKDYFNTLHKTLESHVHAYELLSTGMLQKIPTELDEQILSALKLISSLIPGPAGAVASGGLALYQLKQNKKYQQFYDSVYNFFQAIEVDSYFLIQKANYIRYLAVILTLKNRDTIFSKQDKELSKLSEIKHAVYGNDIDTVIKQMAQSDATKLLKAIMLNEIKPDETSLKKFVDKIIAEHGHESHTPEIMAYAEKLKLEEKVKAVSKASTTQVIQKAMAAASIKVLSPKAEPQQEAKKIAADIDEQISKNSEPRVILNEVKDQSSSQPIFRSRSA